jgi:hypothetical protein
LVKGITAEIQVVWFIGSARFVKGIPAEIQASWFRKVGLGIPAEIQASRFIKVGKGYPSGDTGATVYEGR